MANEFNESQFAAGDATTPTIHFGDAGTGIYRNAENQIGIAHGGALRHTFAEAAVGLNGALNVSRSSASASATIETYRDNATQSSIALRNARGSRATPANLLENDTAGILNFSAWRTGTTFGDAGVIRYRAT